MWNVLLYSKRINLTLHSPDFKSACDLIYAKIEVKIFPKSYCSLQSINKKIHEQF